MAAKLLLVGDVHLGRRPGRLPEDLGEWGLTPGELTPAAGWRAAVDLALRERVDALVLAGDVVEAKNARFEAFGKLEEGVRRLTEQGVSVLAVAGNHDVETLPRLADLIPGFQVIGRGGEWHEVTVEHEGRPAIHVLGWSFPAPRFRSSPVAGATLPAARGDGLPRIGILHGDLDNGASPYAPVSRAELMRQPVDGWFLGHLHKPSMLAGERPIGYLGSLVGLDPTETGAHGPWILEVEEGRVRTRQVPLSPLRWEATTVEVGALAVPEDLLALIDGALGALHDRLRPALDHVRAVGCRVRLIGATPLHHELMREVDSAAPAHFRRRHDEVLYFVDKIVDRTRPPIDLARIAKEDHPAALLARRLIALEENGPDAVRLIRRARKRLERVADEPCWSGLDRAVLDDRRIRELLLQAGIDALELLLRQVEPVGHGVFTT